MKFVVARVVAAALLLSACGDEAATSAGIGGSGGVAAGGRGGAGGAAGTGASGGLGGSGAGGVAEGGGGSRVEPPTSQGCVDGQGLAEGEHSFMLEDRARRYVLRLPLGYTKDKSWPLVLALHGNGGSVSYWDVTSGERNIRGVLENEAILVIAEAIDGAWRDYDMPPESWPARMESELLYFEQVLSQVRADLCIKEDAIFSMGFSGGGSFSGVLGCRRSDIRALAVGGSVIYFDEADCINSPAAWITIGSQELTPDREAFRDYFRDSAGCSASSVNAEPSPCVAYDDCASATPVHYCEHPDGHIWPAFGSEAMWAFFSQFVAR